MTLRLERSILGALAIVAAAASAAGAQERASLVLRNGLVVTVDSARPFAQAIAVAGDRIVAVGTNAEVDRYTDADTRVIDLAGMLAVPGFIEGHGHFMGLGEAKMQLDLTTARSWDDIVRMVDRAAAEAAPGEWILGRGWHQEKWERTPVPAVDGNPVHASLSEVSPHNPVYLMHASGHAAFANAMAMELAGITASTADPDGGEIVHAPDGEPTGLLREAAQRLVDRARGGGVARSTPVQREARARRMVDLAARDALSKGITSFHDAGADFATIDFFRGLAERGELPLRLYVMVRQESAAGLDSLLPRYRLDGVGNGFLTVRSIKRQIDGALGSHGAWLLEPYVDLPRSTGLALESPPSLEEVARVALRHGFQLNTHAIGDRANREVLDVYERVFRESPRRRDLRWRIEHAQHIEPSDLPRFLQLGVIASMQGIHTTSDAPWIPAKLGLERAHRESYLFRSLWDLGVIVTNGTDAPVEDVDPIPSFYGMVTRVTKHGDVFMPEERLTRAEALRAYTLNNAYAAFQERDLGSLTPGKYADITVLSKNIMTVPEDEIPTARVVYTIVAGEVRYQAAGER
jgi:predicted amidohydrolase YtcJ